MKPYVLGALGGVVFAVLAFFLIGWYFAIVQPRRIVQALPPEVEQTQVTVRDVFDQDKCVRVTAWTRHLSLRAVACPEEQDAQGTR